MAKYTVLQLEKKVRALTNEMIKIGEQGKKYKQLESTRSYYVGKLSDMDENDLLTIEI
jgi:hypothetical protein